MKLDIKPLSVNKCWQGRRFKTPAYKQYEKEVLMLLRPVKIPKGNIEIYLEFGFSSKMADFDNPVKPFVDCLQKKYGFNDRFIKRAVIEVKDVEKGCEYIKFEITELKNDN